ncbi:MAG TPA: NAD(P)-binding protein [Acetobacteraceae bacterium]|nr:NAD(P)-binding protein [Acetobacteraceae bacterium]
MRRHVVVIGAGPDGRAAAMLLAQLDVEITVVERREVVGGRSASIHGGPRRAGVVPDGGYGSWAPCTST